MLYDTPLVISQGKAYPGQLFYGEAELCETFRGYPYPKTVAHRGCAVDGYRVIGLCSSKYRQALRERVQDSPRPLIREECLQGIEAGNRDIHSLGFFHNDSNAHTVVCIIISFHSCWNESEHRAMQGAAYKCTDRKDDSSIPRERMTPTASMVDAKTLTNQHSSTYIDICGMVR